MEQAKRERYAAIVLSAGTGRRMNSNIPKQYMMLENYPVLYYSLKAFDDSDVDEVVLVTGAEDIDYCRKEIVEHYGFQKVKAVVAGGSERYLSVWEGLKAADADYVLIHDGARPLIDAESIRASMEAVRKEKACILGVPVKDTIKCADDRDYVKNTPERKSLWIIQTPQSFSYELLTEAYRRLFDAQNKGEELPAITDDAMIVEQMTECKVKIIRGRYENIKITTPEDIPMAKLFLKK